MFISGIADEAGQSIQEQIKAHQELGWRHIEIRNVEGTNLTDVSEKTFDDIFDAVTDGGLTVSCFASRIANWSKDIADPEAFSSDKEELARAIPRMKRFGTPFIRIMSYANKSNVQENEWRDVAVQRIRELSKVAEEGGIILCHENCDGWGGLGPKQSLELLGAIDSPALRAVFDTGNTIHHRQDTMDYYKQVRQHIVYVHIKDGRIEDGKASFVYVGEGQARVADIIKDLKETGYEGGLSIEPHIAAIVHEGKTSAPEELYSSYLEYGRRLNQIVAEIGA